LANQDFRVKNGLQVGSGITASGIITASSFSGSGSGLTSIPAGQLSGTVPSTALSGTYDISIGSGESVQTNTIGVGTLTATYSVAVGSGDNQIAITSTGSITGPSTFIIDPRPVGVGTTSGAVYIKGDLYVQGTQFQVDSTTINLADKVIGVGTTCTSDALLDGAGIGIGSDGNQKTFTFEDTGDNLKSSENLNLASGKSYKIDNTSVLSGTTLGTNVVNSSLTSLGTITTGTWQGNAINDTYIGTINNANKVSLSALNINGAAVESTVVDSDLMIIDDVATGTNKKVTASTLKSYFVSATYADSAGIATYAGNAGIATNLKGGSAGNIPYQSGADTTSFLTLGTSSQVLIGGSSAPTFTNISGLSVGSATNADNVAVTRLDVAGVGVGTTSSYHLVMTDLGASGSYDNLYANPSNLKFKYRPDTNTLIFSNDGSSVGIITGAYYFGDESQNFIAQSSPTGVGNSNVIIGDLAGISTFVGADDKINNSVLIGESVGNQHRGISTSVVIGKDNLSNVTSTDSIIVGNNIGIATDGAVSNHVGLVKGICIGRNIFNNTTKTLNYFNTYPILIGENILSLNVEESSNSQPDAAIVIGLDAAKRRISGNYDIYVGYGAGQGIENQYTINNPNGGGVTGSNIMLGFDAGRYMSFPKRSVVIGNIAGTKVAANDNIIIGSQAGYAVTTGASNILIGAKAGYGLTEGSQNIVIGSAPQTTSGGTGDGPEVNDTSGDRQLVIGAGKTDRWISGDSNFNIGIGHTYGDTISAKLDVKGDVNVSGIVTATSFVGVAQSATKVYVDESEDDTQYYNIIFSDENPDVGDKYHTLQVDNNGLSFNPGLNRLYVNGSLSLKDKHTLVSITTSHTSTAGISSIIDTFAISENDLAEYTISIRGNSFSSSGISTEGTIGITTNIITGIVTTGITPGLVVQNANVSYGTTVISIGSSEVNLSSTTTNVGIATTVFDFGNIQSHMQAQKVLVMHDGTTAYVQEYAIMFNPSRIVSIDATISGSNVLLQATPETGISGITTYKIVRGGLV
jgi:hypothetical protein